MRWSRGAEGRQPCRGPAPGDPCPSGRHGPSRQIRPLCLPDRCRAGARPSPAGARPRRGDRFRTASPQLSDRSERSGTEIALAGCVVREVWDKSPLQGPDEVGLPPPERRKTPCAPRRSPQPAVSRPRLTPPEARPRGQAMDRRPACRQRGLDRDHLGHHRLALRGALGHVEGGDRRDDEVPRRRMGPPRHPPERHRPRYLPDRRRNGAAAPRRQSPRGGTRGKSHRPPRRAARARQSGRVIPAPKARQRLCAISEEDEWLSPRRERKKVAMLCAHLERIVRLNYLRYEERPLSRLIFQTSETRFEPACSRSRRRVARRSFGY